jgi:hypothetical protein
MVAAPLPSDKVAGAADGKDRAKRRKFGAGDGSL